MSESLEQEIRTLRSLFWSERDPDGRVFAPLADAYLRSGETKEALELLSDGMSRHPDFATGHVVAAKLYLEKGMHSEAEIAARRVLELDGDNVVALASLASVLEVGGTEEAADVRARLQGLDPGADVAAEPEAAAVDSNGIAESFANDLTSIEDAPVPALDLDLPAAPDDALDLDLVPMDMGDGGEPAHELDGPDVGAGAGDVPVFDLVEAESEIAEELSLDALAPDPEPVVEETMSLDALAPDPEPVVEETMSLDALAPDPEPVVEETMSLDALAPDPEPVAEETMSLDALAPDPEPVVEETMSLDALAPDPEPVVEETMSLDALAPDPEPVVEDVLSLDALAPDPEPVVEETMSLDALAPDPEPVVEDVLSLDALAPDPEPVVEETMSLDALAPDPEPVVEDVLSLDALAPDPEPVVEDVLSLDALAPDPEPVVEETMSLDALAPDPEPVVEDVLSLDALAPDPEPVVEDVLSLDALAPDPEPVVEDVLSLDALAPDPEPVVEDVLSLDALAPDPEPTREPSAPVFTRTLADLYVKQGFVDKALDVLRHLHEAHPGEADLVARIAELEGGGPVTVAAEQLDEEEVETAARELAESGHGEHEVDTPFAWIEPEGDEAASTEQAGPQIGDYFDGLLSWAPRDES